MIDLTYLKTTTGNDSAIIKELIQIFTTQLPELKEGIASAYEQKNWHNLKEFAHKAKNSFEIIGASEEATNLKNIEILATNEENGDKLLPLIETFLQSCEIVSVEISKLTI